MKLHFLAECLSQPWAMEQSRMTAYANFLAARYFGSAKAGDHRDEQGYDAAGNPLAPQAAAPRNQSARQGGIAVIGVYGTIMQRSSQINICEGGTSTQAIGAALRECMADETVAQVLMDFDTPGGSVFGVDELAAEIRSAKGQKPIIGIANSLCASAGYWLMSQCTECYVTPGGQVGSVGVWMAHEDWSKALEAAGVKTTLVSAGKYKVEGNPYGPLEGDALAFQQSSVDAYYGAFTKAISKGRGVPIDAVRVGMGQGRVLGADAALAEKMVDGVMPLAGVIRKMQSAMQPTPRGRSALSAARNELAILS